jgi:hypothetical protein
MINGQPTEVRNYVGNATIQLSSASNGGAGYHAPACSQQHSAAAAPEPGALALLVFGLVVLGVNWAYRRRIAPPSDEPWRF